jgi:hypothetical protein
MAVEITTTTTTMPPITQPSSSLVSGVGSGSGSGSGSFWSLEVSDRYLDSVVSA